MSVVWGGANREWEPTQEMVMPFYRDNIYPQLVDFLGDPKPIQEIRERIVPLAEEMSWRLVSDRV